MRVASRRARASACITSKPVGDTTTTGTCARVFRKPPFEPAATITSGRAVPASAMAPSASSYARVTMRTSARSSNSPAISRNRSRSRLMPIAQMRGRTVRSAAPAGLIEERSMAADYARRISFLEYEISELK